jgi:hypothetical protein
VIHTSTTESPKKITQNDFSNKIYPSNHPVNDSNKIKHTPKLFKKINFNLAEAKKQKKKKSLTGDY